MDDYPRTIVRGKKRFFTLYVCYAACKQGLVAGCRPIIGIDGCYLKGHQMLVDPFFDEGFEVNNTSDV